MKVFKTLIFSLALVSLIGFGMGCSTPCTENPGPVFVVIPKTEAEEQVKAYVQQLGNGACSQPIAWNINLNEAITHHSPDVLAFIGLKSDGSIHLILESKVNGQIVHTNLISPCPTMCPEKAKSPLLTAVCEELACDTCDYCQ